MFGSRWSTKIIEKILGLGGIFVGLCILLILARIMYVIFFAPSGDEELASYQFAMPQQMTVVNKNPDVVNNAGQSTFNAFCKVEAGDIVVGVHRERDTFFVRVKRTSDEAPHSNTSCPVGTIFLVGFDDYWDMRKPGYKAGEQQYRDEKEKERMRKYLQ